MEQRFDRDFSRVRLHSGPAAEQSAREVNALAYTVGTTWCSVRDGLRRKRSEGRQLMAHEPRMSCSNHRQMHRSHLSAASAGREEEEEEEEEITGLSPKPSNLCGGRPCFTDDEQIHASLKSTAEIEAPEAEAVKDTTPVGVVGPFIVAEGTRASPPVKTTPPETGISGSFRRRVMQRSPDTLLPWLPAPVLRDAIRAWRVDRGRRGDAHRARQPAGGIGRFTAHVVPATRTEIGRCRMAAES